MTTPIDTDRPVTRAELDRAVARILAAIELTADTMRMTDNYRHTGSLDRLRAVIDDDRPPAPPPAGTWIRAHFSGTATRWHRSAGIVEQPPKGIAHGWWQVVPQCNRRYVIHAAEDRPILTAAVPPTDQRVCDACRAIERGERAPVYLAVAS